MSCARSSGKAGAGDPSSGLGLDSSSSTCSLKGELGKGSIISGGWIEKSTGKVYRRIKSNYMRIRSSYKRNMYLIWKEI